MSILSYMPNIDMPQPSDNNIILKPAQIILSDGSTQMAYVQDLSTANADQGKHLKLHKRLTILYLIVGTAALSLSIYVTIKMLHKT